MDSFRRTVAVLIAFATVVAYILSMLHGSILGIDLTTCEEVVAQTGDFGVVEVCGPLSVTALIPPALLVLLLLFPDVEQMKFPWFEVTARRRAEANYEADREEARDDLIELTVADAVDNEELTLAKRRLSYYKAVDSLPDREAEAVRLYFNGRLKQDRVADILGVTQGRVSQIIGNALDGVERQMGERPPARRGEWKDWMGYDY